MRGILSKFMSLKMGDNPPWGMILKGMLSYFLPFSTTSIFELKASAPTSRDVFYRERNEWK